DTAEYFSDKIILVEIKPKKGPVLFSRDEHPYPQTTIQILSKLLSVFVKDTGIVMAVPLTHIVSYSVTGVEPTIMRISPVLAIKKVLKRANLKLLNIGLVEVNKAFALQYLSVEKELGLNCNITNAN
ncbi:20888_t:CDS:2, partial [Racocetra persica]